MVIIATSVGGTTIEILKSLEGQPLKKWDCPSEIGTAGNYWFCTQPAAMMPHPLTSKYCTVSSQEVWQV